jgi:hypothetical protein
VRSFAGAALLALRSKRAKILVDDAEAYVRAGDMRDVLDVTAARRRGRIRANLGLL